MHQFLKKNSSACQMVFLSMKVPLLCYRDVLHIICVNQLIPLNKAIAVLFMPQLEALASYLSLIHI